MILSRMQIPSPIQFESRVILKEICCFLRPTPSETMMNLPTEAFFVCLATEPFFSTRIVLLHYDQIYLLSRVENVYDVGCLALLSSSNLLFCSILGDKVSFKKVFWAKVGLLFYNYVVGTIFS